MKELIQFWEILFLLAVATFVTCLLLSDTGYADQIIVGGGVGVFNSGKNSLSETKMLTASVQEELFEALKDRLTVGGWLDNAGGGKGGSALVAGQMGWEVGRDGLIASIFSGPALISSPDVLLGGRFQFMDDLHLGVQDKRGNYIGIMYRHLSSAGLETPNIGRDIVGLELRW